MALRPHFGGIENEARNCNIYHHRLQITPIKILLHQIARIFRTVVILTNLFRIFNVKAPLGFWVSWNFEELAAMNSMTDPGPGSKARFAAVAFFYSSQFPSFKFPFTKKKHAELPKSCVCEGVSPLCVFHRFSFLDIFPGFFSTNVVFFLREFWSLRNSILVPQVISLRIHLKSWPKLAPNCFRHSIWSSVRDSLAPSSNCGLVLLPV